MAWFTLDVTRALMAHAAVVAFGLVGSVLTARVLGPADRGLYALCFLIAETAVFFASLQLGQSLAYHLGRRGLSGDRVLGALLPLTCLLAALVFAAVRIAEPLLLAAFPQLDPPAVQLAAGIASLVLATHVLTEFFRAADRIDLFNTCRMLRPAVRLLALGLAFALGGRLLQALGAVIAGELAMLPIQLWLLLRIARPRFQGAIGMAASLLGFGSRLAGAAAIAQIDTRIAAFVVAFYTASDQIAFYAIAEGVAVQVLAVPTLVAQVLTPKIARQDDVQGAEMTAATCRSTLFLTFVIAAALAAGSQPVVRLLYGSNYLPVALVLALLLPAAVARSGVRTLSPYLAMRSHVRPLAIANAATLVAHALLLLLLVPRYGIAGAGVATSTGYLLLLAAVAWTFRRLTGLAWREVLVVRRADLARMARAAADAVSLRALRPSGP